jgi:hypothetical protein
MLFSLSLLVILIAFTFSYAQNTYPWALTGNVGVGTTSPQTKLHVYQNTPNTVGLVVEAIQSMQTMSRVI